MNAPGPGEGGRQRDAVARAVAGEQSPVQLDDLGRGSRAQLVAEEDAQVLVDAQRLGGVAARGQRLHEQPVAAFAVARAHDQLARRPLRCAELAAGEGAAPDPLERLQRQLLHLPAARLRPLLVVVGEEARREQVERGLRGLALPEPPGVLERRRCLLDVQPHRLGQRQPEPVAPLDGRRSERAPEPREDRPQGALRVARRPLRPHDADQLAAVDRPVAVGEQEAQERLGLARGDAAGRVAAVDLDGERAAQADPGPGLGHPRSTTARQRLCNGGFVQDPHAHRRT